MRKKGGKSNLVLSRNKLPCFACHKLTSQSKIMLTKDKQSVCEKCYIPKHYE